MDNSPDTYTKHIVLSYSDPTSHVSTDVSACVDNMRTVRLDLTPSTTKQVAPKPKMKRVVATTDKWDALGASSTDVAEQIRVLELLFSDYKGDVAQYVLEQLRQKRSGYRAQDTQKQLYDADMFVTVEDIVGALLKCGLKCFYCLEPTTLIYENVREPRQWSLERIDNSRGHNRDNVEIACLQCNVRHRTMYHERYVATKQIVRGLCRKV